MMISIPGFPSPSTGPIELPDIGEMLLFPAFQSIDAPDFVRFATSFQRYLFSQIPLKNDKKYVTVRSGVWLLEPGTRSHTGRYGDWHIDGVSDRDHIQPEQRVFVLSSPCKSLTEFNETPLSVESSEQETRTQFGNRLCRDAAALGVKARPIEPSRIYCFENHLHRAVDPPRIEFRYFLRVRETDEPPQTREPLKEVLLLDSDSSKRRVNVEYCSDRVSVFYPLRWEQ